MPLSYSLDRNLGTFVGDIKNCKMEITLEQRARLSALGFDWEAPVQKNERLWVEMFAQYKENRSTMTYSKNARLYKWAAYQRSRKSKGKLSIVREQKLNSIGFDWQLVRGHGKLLAATNRPNQQWLAMYHKLVDFCGANSHAMVPRS